MDSVTNQQYRLNFTNQSSLSGDVCIYQEIDGNLVPTAMPLAWIVEKNLQPFNSMFADWTNEYSFVWGEMGQLTPGNVFTASQIISTIFQPGASAELGYENGTCVFSNLSKYVNYVFIINAIGVIPPSYASAGICMNDVPAIITSIEPGLSYTFIPKPQYWLAFGSFQQGEVLDVTKIEHKVLLPFSPGFYAMNVTLQPNMTFVIMNSPVEQ